MFYGLHGDDRIRRGKMVVGKVDHMLVSPPDLQWDSGGGDGAHATAAGPKGFHGSRLSR